MSLLHLLRTSKVAITKLAPNFSMIAQAGSNALRKYIAARGRMPATGSATVPEQIDQALQRLHASMEACEGLLSRLQLAAASVEEVSNSNHACYP
jgi:hypothetical protein